MGDTMIESLYIENFAIIDQVQIDFQSGMTVLTGETGAGKSIIIDAIGQLIGQRSQPSFVKNGADYAFIEGVFSSNKEIDKILLDNNFPIDEHLVISKKINHDGKSAIKINYRNSSQLLLKKIMSQIVDIHSQFETHQLFNESYHLKLLDNFIGNELIDLKKEYLTLYQTYKNLNQKYLSLTKEELTDEQLDFYLAQLKEIEELDLENFDEEEFLKERNNLLNYEKNSQHIKNYKALMDSSKGIMDLFKQSLSELSYLEIDDIKHNYDQLYDLYYTVDGINQDIYDQFSQSYFSEERYNEVQDTFFKLNKLKRKYGQTIDAIIDFKNSLIEKIKLFKNRDQMIENINLKLKETENQLIYYAKKISILRKNKALELEKEVKNDSSSDTITLNLYYKPTVLKVRKTVTGYNMEPNRSYEFTIKAVPPSETDASTATITDGQIFIKKGTDDKVENLTFTNNKATFNLAKDESVDISCLPTGWTYTVTETDPGKNYKTSYKLNDRDATDGRAEEFKTSTTGYDEVTFTNASTVAPPETGRTIHDSEWILLLIVILVISAGGMTFLRKMKKRY